MKRRRFLTISGASLALAGIPQIPKAQVWQWRGSALGARASIQLVHEDAERARHIIDAALGELHRLETIFSLYKPHSALCQLNETGALDNPPLELVDILSQAHRLSLDSDGAFDVTVQPLWQLYAEHFSDIGADPGGPSQSRIDQVLDRIGHGHVETGTRRIAFAKPGMAITLNGIAQGYIADKVADRLTALGVTNTLVDTGEIRALGRKEGLEPWPVRIAGSDRTVLLENQAIATSAAAGSPFDVSGRFHHLIDPRSGRASQNGIRQISVIANRAALADAASTACAIMKPDDIDSFCRQLGVRSIVI